MNNELNGTDSLVLAQYALIAGAVFALLALIQFGHWVWTLTKHRRFTRRYEKEQAEKEAEFLESNDLQHLLEVDEEIERRAS